MKMAKIVMMVVCACLSSVVCARSFEFKMVASGKSKNEGDDNYWRRQKTRYVTVNVCIGKPGKNDDLSEMELRAATIMKGVKDRKLYVNDVKAFKFLPINSSFLKFKVVSATAAAAIDKDKAYYDSSYGQKLAGLVVEIWQNGTCVKHWSSATGPASKYQLNDETKASAVIKDANSYYVPSYYTYSYDTHLDKDERVTKISLEKNAGYEQKLKEAEEAADKVLQAEELKPSGIAPSVFIGEAQHAPIVLKVGAVLSDGSIYQVPVAVRKSHWCVRLNPNYNSGAMGMSYMNCLYGVVPKASLLGTRLKAALQDGSYHSMLIKVAHRPGVESSSVVDILNFKPTE